MYKDSQIIVVIDLLSSSQRCGSGSGIGGSGVFLTPRSGIRERFFLDPGSRILDPQPIFLRVTVFWLKSTIILCQLAQKFYVPVKKYKKFNFVKFVATRKG
jgi:hypothetical protein